MQTHDVHEDLRKALKENDDLKRALFLMGFDPEKFVGFVSSREDECGWYWQLTTLAYLNININNNLLKEAGYSEKVNDSIVAVLSGLRRHKNTLAQLSKELEERGGVYATAI